MAGALLSVLFTRSLERDLSREVAWVVFYGEVAYPASAVVPGRETKATAMLSKPAARWMRLSTMV